MRHWKLFVTIVLLAIAALHYTSVPRSIWEYDESFFCAAVERYEPLRHHPPPPGYPLYIGVAKLVALAIPDPFHALIATSIIAVAAGLLAFLLAFTAIADDRTALVATVLLYASPAVLISGTLPQSDSGALALLGFAIWGCTRRNAALCALLCALCIGWRLQFAIAVVPMFLASVVMMRTWRDRLLAIVTFVVACLCWFVPLVLATGGPTSYWSWLSGQAAYYANHDADLSRSGQSLAHIVLRFIAHPWGPKWLSLPLLALAALGMRRNARTIPLACGAIAYLAFAVMTMDPADAVRYAIPSLPLIAILAATTLRSVRLRDSVAPLLATLYAIGALLYARPVLHARATSVAPPAAAAQWIRQNLPHNTLVLYELPLAPHASYLLRDYQAVRFDEGLAQHGGEVARPMVIYADGEDRGGHGTTFRWPDTDAYRKLTREHYGAVSVIPLPPSKRLTVIEGVFPPERTRGGRWWRWVGARGIIELPSLGATKVLLSFRTPRDYPLAENRVHVRRGPWEAAITVPHAGTAEVIVPITDDDRRITIVPEHTFVPAQLRGANNRDRRVLSVMLTAVSQLDPRRDP